MSRNKGATYERLIANVLKDLGFTEAKRGIGQTRAANEVPDVDLAGWWPELKRHKRTNIKAALEQAITDSKKSGRVPVAICKDDHKDATVTMRLEDWLNLLVKAERP